jgi:hypothetical protein
MKKIVGFIILICIFATCHDSDKPTLDRTQSLRKVGGIIDKEEAQRWRARYEKSSFGARQQSAATISKASLQDIVNTIVEYDGIYFHHALEGSKHHILVIPYKGGQPLWSTSVITDANSDTLIEVATASLWAERYVTQNPQGPWSHFFGRDVFENILSNDAFNEVEIAPAVDDAGFSKLLLYASFHGPTTTGKTKGASEVYDYSSTCPTYCPNSI